jgi:hypothetical protein
MKHHYPIIAIHDASLLTSHRAKIHKSTMISVFLKLRGSAVFKTFSPVDIIL